MNNKSIESDNIKNKNERKRKLDETYEDDDVPRKKQKLNQDNGNQV